MVFTVLMRVLDGMFAVGAVGCVLVLILTTIDDVGVLFHREDKQEVLR